MLPTKHFGNSLAEKLSRETITVGIMAYIKSGYLALFDPTTGSYTGLVIE
jgi:hypothetical protein